MKKWFFLCLIVVLLAAGAWFFLRPVNEDLGLAKGNGRIEATEIDIATKIAGRLQEILVNEGDFVTEGQVLARIDSDSLKAQLAEAEAQHRQAQNAVISDEAAVVARQSDKAAAEAVVAQREAEWTGQKQRLTRTERLVKTRVTTPQELDDDRASERAGMAAVAAGKAQVMAAEAAIRAAEAQVGGAKSTAQAALATIARIKSDLDDCTLKSPRNARVQYRITQAGEVLGVGGKVLNLVDLADVYMTFFLPAESAGRLELGSEARIILDALPEYVIPANVSYVSSVAQFTPKTVETEAERQKLMFRVKAQIDQGLLEKHLRKVKTGVPGMAWVKVDSKANWPERLAVKLPAE